MMTCDTCSFWRRIGCSPVARRIVYDTGVKVVPPGEEGQCCAQPPPADFRWPLTSAADSCGLWRSAPITAVEPATATVEKTMQNNAACKSAPKAAPRRARA